VPRETALDVQDLTLRSGGTVAVLAPAGSAAAPAVLAGAVAQRRPLPAVAG
jgi:hypothetical protein